MNFLQPGFLYALSLIAIPVIIHLFHFKRYKKIYFSDISFLQTVQQEAHTKNRLKNLLILFSRILFIVFLVLAFARPYFPENSAQQTPIDLHVIVIDNSLSMTAESSEGENFNRALQLAEEIISSYPANHKFMLLSTQSFRPKILTREDALEKLTTLQKDAQQQPVDEILTALFNFIDATEYARRYNIFFLSDFQQSTFSWNTSVAGNIAVTWIPLQPLPVANLSIDTLFTATPYHSIFGNETFTAIIANYGNSEKENTPVQIHVNRQPLAPVSASVRANDTTHITFNFENQHFGNYLSEIILEDYPIAFDNVYYFAYQVNDKITVTEIGNKIPNQYTQTLFSGDSLFTYRFFPENNIGYKDLEQSQLIVINGIEQLSGGILQLLKQFVSDGGTLVVFPKTGNAQGINTLLSDLQSVIYTREDTGHNSVAQINYNDPLLEDVFVKENKMLNLPAVTRWWQLQPAVNNYVYRILSLKNNAPFLVRTEWGNGKVYVFTANLQDQNSNLGQHSLFVPLMYNMALQSAGQYLPAYPLHRNTIELPYIFDTEKAVLRHDSAEIIPHLIHKGKKSILFTDEITKPGHYILSDGKHTIPLAFNLKSTESDMLFYSTDELQQLVQEKFNQQQIRILSVSDNPGILTARLNLSESTLWKWFILLALLMLSAEILLIKLWK